MLTPRNTVRSAVVARTSDPLVTLLTRFDAACWIPSYSLTTTITTFRLPFSFLFSHLHHPVSVFLSGHRTTFSNFTRAFGCVARTSCFTTIMVSSCSFTDPSVSSVYLLYPLQGVSIIKLHNYDTYSNLYPL